MNGQRRNDFDVTDTIQVSSPAVVAEAVSSLLQESYPAESFATLRQAFDDFARLFNGEYPGYLGCDTVYHDLQHTLDITLAMARLIAGHERRHRGEARLGSRRAVVGIITSLFHDAGYIRKVGDTEHCNGAEFTLNHVGRSAEFLASYLPQVGYAEAVPVATQIVHYTGFEMDFDDIELEDRRDVVLGHLLGTADLMAQMADRCYLEKCRDRLYPEFVLGGVALSQTGEGRVTVQYSSGLDLLRQTPVFYQSVTRRRLDHEFGKAYRYIEARFDGGNPYMQALEGNLRHLERVIRDDHWRLLRREPPVFAWSENPIDQIRELAADRVKSICTGR